MPQAFGSSGAHIGVGRALVLVRTADFVEAEEIWVEAATPVTTRARTTARIAIFIDKFLYNQLLIIYRAMPQAFGSSGAHIGVGRALVLVRTADFVEAEEICVEAATPVTTRARTTARMMVFMVRSPKVVFTTTRFLWTCQTRRP
jgi:hypothetical protein